MDEGEVILKSANYLCDVAEVPNGEARRVVPGDRKPISVFNLDGSFHAIDDTCSHGNASLSEGEVDLVEGIVACPFHQGCFDIRTGAAVSSPCILSVKAWPITIVDGKIYLDAD
jgi:nitrite reductase/ring-hydroxylating ferredoxin subunit